MADFDRDNPTAPMPGYGRDAASPESLTSERERPLTQQEMESLFDGPPAGAGVLGPPLVDTGSLRGAVDELIERAFSGKGQGSPARQHSNFDPAYQSAAEQYFQAGFIVGRGDATYVVKDELKRLGCKWHGLRERWVAPTAAALVAAKELIKRGPAMPVAAARELSNRERKQVAFKARKAAEAGEVVAVDFETFGEPLATSKHLPARLDPAALLLDLENRGVVSLQDGQTEAAFNGRLSEEELLAAFAESDKAFDL